jgi:hypothetical protein
MFALENVKKCHHKFWLESQKGRGHSEDWGIDGRMDLREIGWGVLSGLNWLKLGTGGELLWMHSEPSSSSTTELVRSCNMQ